VYILIMVHMGVAYSWGEERNDLWLSFKSRWWHILTSRNSNANKRV